MGKVLNAVRSFLVSFVLILFLTVCLLLLIEGAFSVYSVVKKIELHPKVKHVQYDPLLGWANIPNLYVTDIYFPGDYYQVNSQGFRGDRDYTKEVPAGKTRIICSGDSFTMGYGVDNVHGWCHLLGTKAPNLETINMGQGGYGLDQVYLWYMRDGIKFDHQLQIFAFIDDDFNRIHLSNFAGYPKPYFSLINGELVLKNTPVPNRLRFPRLNSVYITNLHYLHTLQALQDAYDHFFPKPPEDMQQGGEWDLPFRIFEKVQEENSTHNRQVVFVYLPGMSEVGNEDNAKRAEFRNTIREGMEKRGMLFLDLTDDFKKLGPAEARELYMWDGHYNEKGNQLVSDVLYEKLPIVLGHPL